MKKLLIILVVSLILLVGCEKQVVCNEPYILVGTECCLDQDSNNICDADEKEDIEKRERSAYAGVCNDAGCIDEEGNIVEESSNPHIKEEKDTSQVKTSNIESKPICFDECSSDSCIGTYYYECKEQSDGCKNKIDRDRVMGKCGVECFNDNDCDSGEECSYYECEPIRCGYSEMLKDGECIGCGREHEQCCDNNECNYGNICDDGICESCGMYNERCCELDRCFIGICMDGKCQSCGGALDICCPGDRCDSEYFKCVDGICELDEDTLYS